MSARRGTSVSKALANHSISVGEEAAKARQKRADASPQRADFEREFGKDKVKDEKDGSWTLSLHERADIKKAHQMQEGSRRLDVERGQERAARWDGKKEKMLRSDGRVVEMREDLIDRVKGKMRSVGRNGFAPSLHFGMSDSYGKYEKGPDGLWFVWNDGWEATTLFSKQPGSPQRDPYGNVWVKDANDEWTLESEVD